MEHLGRTVKAHLRADSGVLHEFTERFALTPLTSSTTGYTVKNSNQKFFTTEATFQIEGNDKVGVVGTITNQDGIKFLELYLEDKTITIDTKKDLARSARALMLSDRRVKRVLGRSISLRQLTRGDSMSSVNGRDVKETFASFEVEGAYDQTGVVSVAATEDDVTELIVYIGGEEIHIEVPQQRLLGATTA